MVKLIIPGPLVPVEHGLPDAECTRQRFDFLITTTRCVLNFFDLLAGVMNLSCSLWVAVIACRASDKAKRQHWDE